MSNDATPPRTPRDGREGLQISVVTVPWEAVRPLVAWLGTQPFGNLLTLLLIGSMVYLVPKHLEEIKTGYREMAAQFAETVKEISARYQADQERDERRLELMDKRQQELFEILRRERFGNAAPPANLAGRQPPGG